MEVSIIPPLPKFSRLGFFRGPGAFAGSLNANSRFCKNGSARTYAGFALQLSHRRGYEVTDATWKVSPVAGEGWNKRKFDDSSWSNAVEVAVLGDPSWDSPRQPFAFVAPILWAKAIWSPEGVRDNQTLYLRKKIHVK